MIIWGMMTWWYTGGLYQCVHRVKNRLATSLDYFSIGLLLRTLFSPFRQISAGNINGSLDMQMRAFVDRLISRCIGAVVRLLMIFIGSVFVLISLLYGLLAIVVWVMLPLMPIIGLALSLLGWLPWNN